MLHHKEHEGRKQKCLVWLWCYGVIVFRVCSGVLDEAASPQVGLVVTLVQAAPPEDAATRNDSAKQIAKAWFTSLMSGETAVTTALSAVPFSFDRKQEVKSLPDLKKLYDQIVAKKGKRDLKPTSIKIESSSPKSVDVVLMIEDEGVVVSVKPGDAFHVVGFSD